MNLNSLLFTQIFISPLKHEKELPKSDSAQSKRGKHHAIMIRSLSDYILTAVHMNGERTEWSRV